MDKKAVCIISGGLDSVVTAYRAKSQGYNLYFLFFNYNQKTLEKEKECTFQIAEKLFAKEIKEVTLPWFSEIGGTILLKNTEKLTTENRALEYVPFRNGMFLSYGISWAENLSADKIFFGSTKGAVNCPDNSLEFFNCFQDIIKIGTKTEKLLEIETPLLNMTKAEVIKYGQELNVPFEYTWSCHNNLEIACGGCSNCEMRLKAFEENSLEDKIAYTK